MATIDQQEVFSWAEREVGGKIIEFERQGGRSSGGRPGWFITCDIDGERRQYYIRGSRSFGFAEGGYTLSRETKITELLHKKGLPVPEVIARSENPYVTLLEFVEGESDFTKIKTDLERTAVTDHFTDIMAQWHSIDAKEFESIGLAVPKTAEEYVLNDLKIWENGCFPYLKEPVPLLTFACKWLRDNIPAAPERPVLVQGDTGPGQFLFSQGKVKSVVDWELAYLGDPMRELAQIRTRDVWYPTGNLPQWFEMYSKKSGVEIDYARLGYYSVTAMLISTLALSPYVQKPHPRDEHAEWYAQDVWAKRATMEALAEVLNIELPTINTPQVRPSRHAKLFDLLVDNLQDEQLPHIDDSFLNHRMNMTLRLVQYMRNISSIGEEINREELEDISQLLGAKQTDYSDAMQALNSYVEKATPDQYESLVLYFYRHSRREGILMEGALGRAEGAVMSPMK